MSTVLIMPEEAGVQILAKGSLDELTLDELGELINAAHFASQQGYRSGIFNARLCGERLLVAKKRVRADGGKFDKWLDENCEFEKGHARRYMRLARNWDTILARAQDLGIEIESLSLREALRLLNPREATKLSAESRDKQPPAEIDEGDAWEEHWEEMPDFDQPSKRPFRTIYVHFEKREDMEAFAKLIGQRLTPKTRYVWYPEQQANETRKICFVNETGNEGDDQA
jgi:hypothetical protein